MPEFKLSTREEIYQGLEGDLAKVFPRVKTQMLMMDIEYLMDQKAKQVLEELLEIGDENTDWKKLIFQKKSEFDYD